MILFTLYASALFSNGFIHVDAIDTQRAFIGKLVKIHRCEIWQQTHCFTDWFDELCVADELQKKWL